MKNKKKKTKLSLFTRAVAALGSVVLSLASTVTALAMVSYSGYVIYDSIYTNRAAFSSWDLSQYRPVLEEDGELSFEELQKVNPDTVGWLTIQGTNIDYPVVQGKDDLEYASKDVFGNNSLSGSIYLTTANTRDFTNSFNLIYGHHMDNGAMFGDIEKYEDYDFFHQHQDGILVTTLGTYDLKVFARISTDAYDSRIYSAGDRRSDEFPDFLEYVKSLAIQWQDGTDIYDITDHIRTYLLAREANIEENGHFVWDKMPRDAIENGMQLLALSTCSDATTNGRQILFATMKIRTEPLPVEMINKEPVPMSAFGHKQSEYWALLNLLCLLMTLIILLPGLAIPAKYTRLRWMKRANHREGTRYRTRRFRIKMLIGMILEIVIAAGSVICFVMTENLRRPMTVVDRYTPWMLALLAAMLLVDILLIRYWDRKYAARAAAA